MAAAGLLAMATGAGEFRRIAAIDSVGNGGGRLVIEDWDGDGELELLRGDLVDEYGTGPVGRYIILSQIYEISEGAWAARYGFMHHYGQLYGAVSDRVKREDVKYSISGDFNGDGIEDVLIAEPGPPPVPVGDGVKFVLRLKQAGEVLYEDPLDGVYAGPDDNFNRFELLDIDGDGTKEVLVWIVSYRENDRLIIYGSEKSKWGDSQKFDVPNQLNDALLFLKGIRAARPEKACPVEVGMEVLKDSDFPSFSHPRVPGAKRFKLSFKARPGFGEVDVSAWRDYFQQWAIAYTRESDNGVHAISTHSAWGLHMVPEGDGLLAAIGIRKSKKEKPVGWHGFWLECAFVGADSKPFRWIGTLQSQKVSVFFENEPPVEGDTE